MTSLKLTLLGLAATAFASPVILEPSRVIEARDTATCYPETMPIGTVSSSSSPIYHVC